MATRWYSSKSAPAQLSTFTSQIIGTIATLVFGIWAVKSYHVGTEANSLAQSANELSKESLEQSIMSNRLTLLSLCLQFNASSGVNDSTCDSVITMSTKILPSIVATLYLSPPKATTSILPPPAWVPPRSPPAGIVSMVLGLSIGITMVSAIIFVVSKKRANAKRRGGPRWPMTQKHAGDSEKKMLYSKVEHGREESPISSPVAAATIVEGPVDVISLSG